MKFTAVIVEDLSVAADVLQKYCIKSGKVNVVGSFKSTEEAIPYLSENSVDLIFLDIEMPGANGFSLLDQMQYQPQVILTTSKTEYAFDAFEYSVTDFLRKPFSYQRFAQALEKLKPLNEKKRSRKKCRMCSSKAMAN